MWSALATGFATALLLAGPASAEFCFGDNEGAVRAFFPPSTIGFKANVDLSPATPVDGYAIAHPAQVISPSVGNDFFGWGTYKGENVAGNCPDYLGTGWRIYVDGIQFNVYFCESQYGTVTSTAQDQELILKYQYCPSQPQLQRWTFYWEGAFKTCRSNSFTWSNFLAGGGESAGTLLNQEIDVKWDGVFWWVNNGWGVWGTYPIAPCADFPYRVRVYNSYIYWTELP